MHFFFLTLPHLQWFTGLFSEGGSYSEAALKYKNLETIWLQNASMDEVELSTLLRRTPCLKTLRFMPFTEEDSRKDWDLCKFVMTIERIVGNQLVNLCIALNEAFYTPIAPGQASLRGFKKLKRLALPLDIVLCNLAAGSSRTPQSLIQDFIPASVTHFAFGSSGLMDGDADAIAIMFRGFAISKPLVPSLQEIHLTLTPGSTELYEETFAKVSAEISRAGVSFVKEEELMVSLFSDDEDYDDEYYDDEEEEEGGGRGFY